jgi:hypothetical protein
MLRPWRTDPFRIGGKEGFEADKERFPVRQCVPGVGHVWNLEAPDLFNETVRAWITDQPLPQKLMVYG